jgi:putative SOS response-associated peptidase YedK
MCAHYDSPPWSKLAKLMTVTTSSVSYSADVWPGKPAPFLHGSDCLKWEVGCFGLMPHWAKQTLFRQTYNARSETVATKPTYRQAWKARQFCAVPAQAFYEPNYETGRAESHRIERQDKEIFWLAGLWESFRDNFDQQIFSFTLLTINAEHHPLMSHYHGLEDEKRSVVVLPPNSLDSWIQAKSEQEARAFLTPFAANDFVGGLARGR